MFSSAYNMSSEPVRIGPVSLDGRAILAPMSGVTDVAMRRIARRFGASEFVAEGCDAERIAVLCQVKFDDGKLQNQPYRCRCGLPLRVASTCCCRPDRIEEAP